MSALGAPRAKEIVSPAIGADTSNGGLVGDLSGDTPPMARALGLVVALILLAVPAASALDEPTGPLIAGSEESALRLHDLPPGYRLGNDGGCGPLSAGGEEGEAEGPLERRYLQWIVSNRPE